MKIENVDKYIIFQVISAYLVESKSHRQIQREILGLPAPANGGGFETMTILHHFNLKKESKGILKDNLENTQNISSEVQEILKNFQSIQGEAEQLIERKPINPTNKDTERWSTVKSRVYQDVLKKHVSENYSYICALCDNDQPELLVASHIIPWNSDKEKRLDLGNCILFCNFHDKLFDRGFITLDQQYNLIISDKLSKNVSGLLPNHSFKIPHVTPPNQKYLNVHREEIFRK